MARYNPKTKGDVRSKYINQCLSLKVISEMSDIPYGTLCRWKSDAKDKGDDWDKQRAVHSMTSGSVEDVARNILNHLVVKFKATMELIEQNDEGNLDPITQTKLLASLTDSYNKAISANNKLMPETDKIAIAMQVIKLFVSYIKEVDPDLLENIEPLLESFGKKLQRELQ